MATFQNAPLVSVTICFPPDATYLQHPNGTLFTGTGDWVMANIAGPQNIPIEYNIHPTPSNQTLAQFQTLADGKADILPVEVIIAHKYYQYFDYSPAIKSYEVEIISRKFEGVMGSVIKDVFDWKSYGMIVLSLMVFISFFLWGSTLGYFGMDK